MKQGRTVRIKRLRQRLKHTNAQCLVIVNPANVSYITGFMGHDSWAVVTAKQVYLLTDSRYIEQAQKECTGCTILERSGSLEQLVAARLNRIGDVQAITVEDTIPISVFSQLKRKLRIPVKPITGCVEVLRRVKDKQEIGTIKKAVKIAKDALQTTLPLIKPGRSEAEVAGLLDLHIRKLDATNAFSTIVAFGANASRPHHHPGTRKLRHNDSILIDFGARYQGYCSDITRCFSIGRSTRQFDKAYQVVQDALAAALNQIRPGVLLSEVDEVARSVIRESGFPVYGHGSGHGLGLDIHESPFLKPDARDSLASGQVITIEPGIYIPGKLGIRLEEDVLVTDKGKLLLTANCPHVRRLEDFGVDV